MQMKGGNGNEELKIRSEKQMQSTGERERGLGAHARVRAVEGGGWEGKEESGWMDGMDGVIYEGKKGRRQESGGCIIREV